ncbi:RNA polymerase sigma-70 factor [Alistipes sp.]|uniref:RNA polymerase sigma-70 factor n=1 Tax=Alistipes sp. TaxID=1872444 RepID=UPI003AF1197F
MNPETQTNRFEFGQLYTQWYRRFVVIARRYVRDAVVAEDLVTDSFVAFWENRERLADDLNAPAYLLTSVKNNCLNYLQAQQTHLRIQKHLHGRQYRMVSANIASLEACDPERLFAEEVSQIVRQALSTMPELTRIVFEANRFYDKTYAEIAREQGITVRRVTSEMQRALALLRAELKDYLPVALILLGIKEIS